ncbi:hypothetical protein DFH08DRAFT_796517 [Mycena albidolilacea]|uniref:Ribosome maturation protein SDO1/SBDS N-terminal domain-containing protein n=1 Tax=Mycena albidolilacea TaxID=1033008 RepID=A0AAD7F4S6_9AGAR|nr:hypothetical protein DFH08DRAFT_796517 [Mycena albidolilacea]
MSAKVIYTYRSKAGTKEDYIVLVDQPAEYDAWKKAGAEKVATNLTFPSPNKLPTFAAPTVYVSTTGPQGLLGKPSEQQLATAFGTHVPEDEDDGETKGKKGAHKPSLNDVAVLFILKNGETQGMDGIATGPTSTNVARGNTDTRGGR